jgi:hypothetical protein
MCKITWPNHIHSFRFLDETVERKTLSESVICICPIVNSTRELNSGTIKVQAMKLELDV